MTADLQDINEKLKALIAHQDAQIRLVIQTGTDETGMVATTDGYLRLAQLLIEFILKAKEEEAEIWSIYGHQLPGSSAIYDVFRENFEVSIDTLMLAENQLEVSQIAQAFWDASPDSMNYAP